MAREAFRQKVQAEMQRVLDALVAEASESRQDMAAMERKIYAAANGLKPALLQAWLDKAEDDSARPVCPHCGRSLRQKQQVPKTCVCEGGLVEVRRTRWWCLAWGEVFFPLDEATTVGGYPISPEAGRIAVEGAATTGTGTRHGSGRSAARRPTDRCTRAALCGCVTSSRSEKTFGGRPARWGIGRPR